MNEIITCAWCDQPGIDWEESADGPICMQCAAEYDELNPQPGTASCDTCSRDDVPAAELKPFPASGHYPEGACCRRCRDEADRELLAWAPRRRA